MRPSGRLPCLNHSWWRKARTSFLKKAPQKILRVSDPTRISPFMVPTRKEAPTGNAPMGAIPHKAVTNRFLPTGENKTSEAGNPSSQWLLQSLKQSTGRRSPPFFQQRLASKQLFIQRVKHCHQWLRTAIPLKTKLGQISSNIREFKIPVHVTRVHVPVEGLFS